MGSIHFFKEDISYRLNKRDQIIQWLQDVAHKEKFSIDELNIILCSDEFLVEMNRQYLDHDTYTDIITFDNSINSGKITGELYISVERVKENAATLKIQAADELHRVMVHGVLHLCGYGDKTKTDKKQMTSLEDFYLSLRNFV